MSDLFARVRVATGRKSPALVLVEFDEALRMGRHGPSYAPDKRPVPPRQEGASTKWSQHDGGGSRFLCNIHRRLPKQMQRSSFRALTARMRAGPRHMANRRGGRGNAKQAWQRYLEEESQCDGVSSPGCIEGASHAPEPPPPSPFQSSTPPPVAEAEETPSVKEILLTPKEACDLAQSCLRSTRHTKHSASVESTDTLPSKLESAPPSKSGSRASSPRPSVGGGGGGGGGGAESSRRSSRRPSCADPYEAIGLSSSFGLPMPQILHMRGLFDKYDSDGDERIDRTEFQLLVRSVLKEHYPFAKDVPKELFDYVATSDEKKLNFEQVLKWYSAHAFSERFLLSSKDQKLREVARRWNIPITEVEHMKAEFDKYDTDGSGQIDYEEFRQILVVLLKVPRNVDLPENRVRTFWSQMDRDGSGGVDFEEFLAWYRRYFDVSGAVDNGDVINTFYESVRLAVHRKPIGDY